VTQTTERYYDTVFKYPNTQQCLGLTDDSDAFSYAAGWALKPDCSDSSQFDFDDQRSVPCSINTTTNPYTLANPVNVYMTLDTGISQISSNFTSGNSTSEEEEEEAGTATSQQVITYTDPATGFNHSLLFNIDSPFESNFTDTETHDGYDYTADTMSMVTDCVSITNKCQFSSKAVDNQNNTELPVSFNCSDHFYGDLSQMNFNGLERLQGWNTSFFDYINGVPTSIPFQTQLNPFHFEAAAVINSISMDTLVYVDDPQAHDGDVYDAKDSRVAFALSCNATIYDVSYSIIGGSIVKFNATPSAAWKAAVIKAPLQIGFGVYHLFQSASLAALLNHDTIVSYMKTAFSQTGIALAAGVFICHPNFAERLRYDKLVTRVPLAPVWAMVILCLLYSLLGLVMVIAALVLRRRKDVLEKQVELTKTMKLDFKWKMFWEWPKSQYKKVWGLEKDRVTDFASASMA
jgi:hypothetical protein